MAAEDQAGSSTETNSTLPHSIRITGHGKMHSFVSFALKFLQENPQRPLVFHTLPPDSAKDGSKPSEDAHPDPQQIPNVNHEPENSPTEEPPRKRRKLATTTATITRLVSVVEIVRREYGKWAAVRKNAQGEYMEDALRAGLHQYNQLTCLEDLGLLERAGGSNDVDDLRSMLEGKNYLQQKFTPHLKVTLSVCALPELEEDGATHQPPAPPAKLSKSAKARQRKRQKKNEQQMSQIA